MSDRHESFNDWRFEHRFHSNNTRKTAATCCLLQPEKNMQVPNAAFHLQYWSATAILTLVTSRESQTWSGCVPTILISISFQPSGKRQFTDIVGSGDDDLDGYFAD